jgi:hypothetical protein
LTEAAQYAQQGATPITSTPYTAANVDQYMSPYQGDVVNSTEAQLNNQDAIQQQQLTGSAISAGAFGGDRSGVAQGVLGGQQALANNSTIANLENTGFANAQGQFNTQNQAQMTAQQASNSADQAASYALGSLGPTAENTALSGANALLGAGTTEQNVAQENLNVPYEQYLQQQAYPYQSLAFEAGLLPGVAQGTGISSTGSTTGSLANSQTGNTNTSSTPALFGSTGSGSIFTLASGGRAPRRHLVAGGLPYSVDDSINSSSAAVPDPAGGFIPSGAPGGTGTGGLGYSSANTGMNVPTMNMNLADSPTTATPSHTGSQGSSLGPSDLSNAYNWISGLGSTSTAGDAGMSGVADMGAGIGGSMAGAGGVGDFLSGIGSGIADAASGALAFIGLQDGGRPRLDNGGNSDSSDQPLVINPMDPGELASGGNVRRRLDDGGSADFDTLLDQLYPGPGAAQQPVSQPQRPAGASAMTLADTPPEWRGQATNYAPPPATGENTLSNVDVTPQAQPTWDNGEPVNKGLSDAWKPGAAGREVIPQHDPSIWPSVLAGIGGLFDNKKGAIPAAMEEYEKDANPTVDHSGAEMLVRYNNGPTFGTGIPTESALNARAMADYRQANLDSMSQYRTDQIGARNNATNTRADTAEAALREKTQHDADMADIRAQIANNGGQGRYGQPVPGKGIDPASGQIVDGLYAPNLHTGKADFQPFAAGAGLTAKPVATRQTGLPSSAAVAQARKDYAGWAAKDPDGKVYNSDGSPADPTAWITSQAGKYMSGALAHPGVAPQGNPATPATANAPRPVAATGAPPGVVNRNVAPSPQVAPQGPTASDGKGNKVHWNGAAWVPMSP